MLCTMALSRPHRHSRAFAIALCLAICGALALFALAGAPRALALSSAGIPVGQPASAGTVTVHTVTASTVTTSAAHGDSGGKLSGAAIAAAVAAGVLALGCLMWALGRALAYEPRWTLSLRHAMGEIGQRASATLAELGDWARLGR